ncbi:dephospho-CoA kinase [Nitrosomonas ureae]|uniref:Dephospho-CoA kinase n=1 Tax=Nitrosomonas ureae TaxID=44577 RepID=A0A1H8ZI16_9PROT|nr:dephospho-CoA kinase [Nitrosomonas ureae]PTQ87487.1 dephospho-CoA kinase [Nitrosomonas ureae]SEP64060.1 dephospho-CoA kinase [Nitrosomonas ureae]
MTLIVGLTGGIGSGKSTVGQYFVDLGIDVIDTDAIARMLTEPDGLAMNSIKDSFGQTMLAADGSLNRVKMRNLIFSDNNYKLALENILHPLILAETLQQVSKALSPYIIIAIPLLFETNDYDKLIQRSLVVDCEEKQQILRTMKRSKLPENQIKAIIATQISRASRLQKADDIIVNNLDIAYLKVQVAQLHKKYLSLS